MEIKLTLTIESKDQGLKSIDTLDIDRNSNLNDVFADLNLLNYAYLVGDEGLLSRLNDALTSEDVNLKIVNKENNDPIGFKN